MLSKGTVHTSRPSPLALAPRMVRATEGAAEQPVARMNQSSRDQPRRAQSLKTRRKMTMAPVKLPTDLVMRLMCSDWSRIGTPQDCSVAYFVAVVRS